MDQFLKGLYLDLKFKAGLVIERLNAASDNPGISLDSLIPYAVIEGIPYDVISRPDNGSHPEETVVKRYVNGWDTNRSWPAVLSCGQLRTYTRRSEMLNTLAFENVQVAQFGDVPTSEERYSLEVSQRLRSLRLDRFAGEGTNGAGKKVTVDLERCRYLIDGKNGDGESTQVEINRRLKQVTGKVCG